MAYILLPSESINLGGWHGLDGQSVPFSTEYEGWWADLPILSGNTPGTKLNYAVEISTNYNITDTTIGLVEGVFRFVTGRPGYDGATGFPNWGPNEDESGTIFNKWYEGFLTKDGLSNPARAIDISKGGDYGTLSSFTFKIRNNAQFWKSLIDHRISLINKPVRLFVIINDVFYQIWGGVITEIPRTANEFIVKCADNSQSMHKDLPNKYIGDIAKPVILGNVNYLKATRINSSRHIQLTSSSNSAPFYRWANIESAMNVSGTLDQYNQWRLDLMTDGKVFAQNALSGYYLKISRFQYDTNDTENGAISSRSADKDTLLYIYKSDATVENSGLYYGRSNITSVYTKQAPVADPPFNDSGSLNYYDYFHNLSAYPSFQRSFTMYVEVIDINAQYAVAQSGVALDLDEIYQYDEDKDEYYKLPVNGYDNGDGTFNLGIPFNLEGEELSFYQPLKSAIKAYNVLPDNSGIHQYTPLYTYYTSTDASGEFFAGVVNKNTSYSGGAFNAFLIAYDATSSGNYMTCNVTGSGYSFNPTQCWVTVRPDITGYIKYVSNPANNAYYGWLYFQEENQSTFISKMTDLSLDPGDYLSYTCHNASKSLCDVYIELQDEISSDDDLYIMADYCIDSFWKNTEFRVHWRGIDQFGKEVVPDPEGDDAGRTILYEHQNKYAIKPAYFFGLPEAYYRRNWRQSPNLTRYSFIPAVNNYYYDYAVLDYLGNPDSYQEGFGKEFLKVPDSLKEMYLNGQIKYFKVTFEVKPVSKQNYKFVLFEVGCFIKRKQSLDKELYIRSSGVYSSSGAPTNTVYGMFKYILEENDIIPANKIVYNNLQECRTSGTTFNWVAGRIFNKVDNSKNYLKELARHSYVALYPDRRGRRAFNCWLESSGSVNHDDYFVVRDSIESFEMTPVTDVFNVFNFEYDFDYGLDKFRKVISVRNTSEDSFPSESEDWTIYVSGISDYNIAKGIWNTAHSGYLITSTNYSPGNGSDKLPYYVYSENNDYTSPILYLINMVNWTSRQHYQVEYAIPITSGTINTELTDIVLMRNSMYTNNDFYQGYIDRITYDLKNDQIKITAFLDPNDGWQYYDLPEPEDPVESGIIIIDAETNTDRDDYNIYNASCSGAI